MTDEPLPESLSAEINNVLDEAGVKTDRRLVMRMMRTAVLLGEDGTNRLDLKIASAALAEMRDAFRLFAPFEGVPKVTVFGSARTRHDDPLYVQARDVAAALAADGWMVVTGAGPGIMQAAAEGAGPALSLGVSIRLPFEEKANSLIAASEHVVAMKYFFTRKLMLIKESSGFICLPGGFGTLDEMFELLTLQQTGKMVPVPIVLLGQPRGTYWSGFMRFVLDEIESAGFTSPGDLDRVLFTQSADEAIAHVRHFWSNYDGLRWFPARDIGSDSTHDTLMIYVHRAPTSEQLASLNVQFAPMLQEGEIELTEPFPGEGVDHEGFARLKLILRPRAVGDLYKLIGALNDLVADDFAPVGMTQEG